MNIPEIKLEYVYTLAGIISFLLISALFIKRKKVNKKSDSIDEKVKLYREEIIAVANDNRNINRMLPIANKVAKSSLSSIIDDEEYAAAICKILFHCGEKILCRQILEKTAQAYSEKTWHSELEILFLTSKKNIDARTLFKIQNLHRKFPENENIILFWANRYDKKKNYNPAQLETFCKAVKISPKELKWKYACARCLQNEGNLSGALDRINQILQINSGFPGAQDLKKILENQIKPPEPIKSDVKKEVDFASERYSQITEMGRGGMGIVYKAFDEVLQRWVAIKTLPESIATGQPDLKKRFFSEARVLAAIDHPTIPKIFDLSLKPPYYLAFELIDGVCLRKLIEENPQGLSLKKVFRFAVDITSALSHACSKNILHRDIKPENILVQNNKRCYVIDFGLAQAEGQINLTEPGLIMGTPWYLAPERFRGEPATIASEIYALGVMLYEMLEGNRPYEGKDVNVVMIQKPKEVSRQGVSSEFKFLINECLSKNPANRPEEFPEILTILKRELKKID